MFAPVVHRFLTYAVDVAAPARAYMSTMTSFAPFKEWTETALKETLVIEAFEGD
jgi:glutathione S-transferase